MDIWGSIQCVYKCLQNLNIWGSIQCVYKCLQNLNNFLFLATSPNNVGIYRMFKIRYILVNNCCRHSSWISLYPRLHLTVVFWWVIPLGSTGTKSRWVLYFIVVTNVITLNRNGFSMPCLHLISVPLTSNILQL